MSSIYKAHIFLPNGIEISYEQGNDCESIRVGGNSGNKLIVCRKDKTVEWFVNIPFIAKYR